MKTVIRRELSFGYKLFYAICLYSALLFGASLGGAELTWWAYAVGFVICFVGARMVRVVRETERREP